MRKWLILAFGMTFSYIATADGKPGWVAGSQPDRRPAQAPHIQQHTQSPAWYAQALRGVYQPFPPSLGFLEAQGAWYTPFNRPGMPAPYDLRGWHSPQTF